MQKISLFKSSIILCCVSFIVSLAVGEIIIRKILPRPYICKTSNRLDVVKEYGFIDEAMLDFNFPQKRGDQKYILLVGDSYIHDGSFTTIFESSLHNETDDKYIVRNLATGGWGNDQEYIALKNLALKYEPDIVVLAFCLWNDIADNLSAFERAHIKPYFILKDNELILCGSDRCFNQDLVLSDKNKLGKLLHSIHYGLSRISYLYYYATQFFKDSPLPLFSDKKRNIDGSECPFDEFSEYVKADNVPYMFTDRLSHYLAMVKDPKPSMIKNGQKVYISDYGYDLTGALLKCFNRDITGYGGKFYVLLLPLANPFGLNSRSSEVIFTQADGQEVTIDFMYQINKLKRLCKASGIKTIDFTDEMESQFQDSSELLCSQKGAHYNKKGDDFLGKQLYEYFINNID